MEWLESVDVGVGAVDRDGVIVRVNGFLAGLIGESPRGLVGRSVHELLSAKSAAAVEEHLDSNFAGMVSSYRIDLRGQGGLARSVLVQAAPSFDSTGQVVGSVAMVTVPPASESRPITPRLDPTEVAGCPLTPRECQVASGLRSSGSASALAIRLGISTHTVQAHLQSAYRKLGVSSRVSLIGSFDCASCARGRFVCRERRA